jgi:hypothetical protein
MANKELDINLKVNTSGLKDANTQIKELAGATKELSKNVSIKYDIDGTPLEVVTNSSLTLKKEIRALYDEIQKLEKAGQSNSKEFKLLSQRYNETKDSLDKANLKSRELFGTMSLLPGPIGEVGSALGGTVDLLKTFSSFKLTDIKNQFKELKNDLKDILIGFSQFGSKDIANQVGANVNVNKPQSAVQSTKETVQQTATLSAGAATGTANAVNELTDATNKSIAASNVQIKTQAEIAAMFNKAGKAGLVYDASLQTVTTAEQNAAAAGNQMAGSTNTVAAAEETATVATSSWTVALGLLQAVLYGLGIGIIIAALFKLYDITKEMILGTKALAREFKNFDESLTSTARNLEAGLQTYKNFYDERIGGLRKNNAEAKQIRDEELVSLTKQQKAYKDNQKILDAAVQESLDRYMSFIKVQKDGTFKPTMFHEEDAAKAKEQYEKAVEQYNAVTKAGIDIDSQIIQKGLDNQLQNAKEAADRRLKNLDILIKREEEANKTDLKKLEEYLTEKARIEAYWGHYTATQRSEQARQNARQVLAADVEDQNRSTQAIIDKGNKELVAYRVMTVDNKNQIFALREDIAKKEYLIELNNARLALADKENKILEAENNLNSKLKGIAQDRENFYLQQMQKEEDIYVQSLARRTISSETQLAKDQKLLMDNGQQSLLQIQDSTKTIQLHTKQYLKDRFVDMQAAFQYEHDYVQLKYQNELTELDASFQSKLISEQAYADKKKEINDKIYNNDQQLADRTRQLDQVKIDAKRATADAEMAIAEGVVGLLNAIAGKSIELQKAAAIAEAIMGIAKVVIATNVAIAEFSASVAPLGPIGVPMAVAYATKMKISEALSIAAITVGAIAKISSIGAVSGSGSSSSTSGDDKTRLKNYGDGGMIEGPMHAQGGTLINAEGGEAVMTRGAVTMFRPLLSALNMAGGGTSFTQGAVGQAKYDAPKSTSPNMDNPIFKTYVVESELSTMQHRNARLKELSTI